MEIRIKEPDQTNDKLWFWHYPYNAPANDNTQLLLGASDKVTKGLSTTALSAKYPSTVDYTNAIFDAIDFEKARQLNGGDVEAKGLWDWTGYRAKVFYPQVPFHTYQRLDPRRVPKTQRYRKYRYTRSGWERVSRHQWRHLGGAQGCRSEQREQFCAQGLKPVESVMCP